MSQVFRPLADRRMHVLTDADDNVNDKSHMSLALDVLLSEHRDVRQKFRFVVRSASLSTSRKIHSFGACMVYSVAEAEGRFKRRSSVP